MRILLTGATGLIGRALIAASPDVELAVTTRQAAGSVAGAGAVAQPPGVGPPASDDVAIGQRLRPVGLRAIEERLRPAGQRAITHHWDAEAGPLPAAALRGVDAVVHLAGEGIADARWTPARKVRLRDSRVRGTHHLVAALAALPAAERPRTLISESAVGFYGDRGDTVLDETTPAGQGFLAELCAAWEAEAQAAATLGLRVVCLRTGVVLAPNGGALARMLPLFRAGLGGRLGSGRQWMPWIHVDDMVGVIRHALRATGLAGPVNAVAPTPIRQADFARALGRTLHRPAVIPAPALALRLALGELSEVLLASQRCAPAALLADGYVFKYPEVEAALREVT